jgi:hypothetical protein
MNGRQRLEAEARALRRAAEAAGVFGSGRSIGATGEPPPATDGIAFSAAAIETLIAKPIVAIGTALSALGGPRLFVYTRRRLTVAERRILADGGPTSPIEFRVARPFAVEGPSTVPHRSHRSTDPRLRCGGSIGIGNAREAGTLGALLVDRAGVLHGLSCNHVVGGCSNARIGLPIVAPGILDVAADAPPPATIGLHARALPFHPGDPAAIDDWRDNTDAAVFRLTDPDRACSLQGEAWDTPTVVAEPSEDAPVAKVGRTTGATTGIVESRLIGPQRIDYAVSVHHSAEETVAFRGSVFFEPIWVLRGDRSGFAASGDSGALVVETSAAGEPIAAVGLVIGGRGGEETWMLPLAPILDRLGMTLVGGRP